MKSPQEREVKDDVTIAWYGWAAWPAPTPRVWLSDTSQHLRQPLRALTLTHLILPFLTSPFLTSSHLISPHLPLLPCLSPSSSAPCPSIYSPSLPLLLCLHRLISLCLLLPFILQPPSLIFVSLPSLSLSLSCSLAGFVLHVLLLLSSAHLLPFNLANKALFLHAYFRFSIICNMGVFIS